MRERRWLATLRTQGLHALDLVPGARRFLAELGRVEIFDRSLALAAQALLALVPMLMALRAFAPAHWGTGVTDQIRDVIGAEAKVMQPLQEVVAQQQAAATQTGLVGLVVAVLSATSFSRALQRMYARVWELPAHRGVRAWRGSLLWLVGWIAMLQVTALLVRSLTGPPVTSVLRAAVQVVAGTLVWWWSAWLLLGGRMPWRPLLPGAAATAAAVLVLTRLSALFMPPFLRANLDQYGPLGIVFSIGSWLVLLSGVLVVSAVLGRLLALWWWPGIEPPGHLREQAGSGPAGSGPAGSGPAGSGPAGSGRGTGRRPGGRDVGATFVRDPLSHLDVGSLRQQPAGHEGLHHPERRRTGEQPVGDEGEDLRQRMSRVPRGGRARPA